MVTQHDYDLIIKRLEDILANTKEVIIDLDAKVNHIIDTKQPAPLSAEEYRLFDGTEFAARRIEWVTKQIPEVIQRLNHAKTFAQDKETS